MYLDVSEETTARNDGIDMPELDGSLNVCSTCSLKSSPSAPSLMDYLSTVTAEDKHLVSSTKINCWRLFECLPRELQLRVVAFLPRDTAQKLQSTSPISHTLRLMSKAHEQHLRALHLRLCYGLENHVLEIVSSLFTPRTRLLWPRSLAQVETLEKMHSVIHVVTAAIQRGMPAMQQTTLIRHHLTLLHGVLYFPTDTLHHHFAPQHYIAGHELLWSTFSLYDLDEQFGVLNFVENLWGAWYQQNPVKLHNKVQVCHHWQVEGSSCRWRLCRRLMEEFEELGIVESVVKLHLLQQLSHMFEHLMWLPMAQWNTCDKRQLHKALNTFQNSLQRVWKVCANACSVESGPGTIAFKVQLQLMDHNYSINVYGERGNGTIELELDPQHDILRWLSMAASVPSGSRPHPSDIPDDGRKFLSHVIFRQPYWDKTWYDSNDLGFESFFEG